MKYLILSGFIIYIFVLIKDNVKAKRNIKVLQDSIVVIQEDLKIKDRMIKDYQSRL